MNLCAEKKPSSTQAVCSQYSSHVMARAAAGIRAKLLQDIQKKVLRLQRTDPAVVTAMVTEDVKHVREMVVNANHLWSLPLKTIVILCLIGWKLGMAGFGAVTLATAVIIVSQAVIVYKMTKNRLVFVHQILRGNLCYMIIDHIDANLVYRMTLLKINRNGAQK